nr:DUF4839 domain-containing protein [Pseudoclavibacter chungangensis]
MSISQENIEFERMTVRVLRGTERRAVSKWERQGWRIVSHHQGRLQTEITFQRPKKKMNVRVIALIAGVAAVLLVPVIVFGTLNEDRSGEAGEATSTPSRTDSAQAGELEPTKSADIAVDEVVTVENNAEFAALLDVADTCDSSVAVFAEKYRGRSVEFDGHIGALAPHGSATTRYDILVGPGDFDENSVRGPTFQLRDVNTTSDLHVTGDVPDSIGPGSNVHLVAQVDRYEAGSCLLLLEPVQMSFR